MVKILLLIKTSREVGFPNPRSWIFNNVWQVSFYATPSYKKTLYLTNELCTALTKSFECSVESCLVFLILTCVSFHNDKKEMRNIREPSDHLTHQY